MLVHPIETVLFDLDGTLRHNVPSADDFQYDFALQFGVRDEPGKQAKGARWAHAYWAQSTDLLSDIDQFGLMDDAFWTHYAYRYLRALDVPRSRALDLAPRLFQCMQENFEPESHIYPCAMDTLGKLKTSGYTLGLVSNRSRPCQEECQQLGLLEYFEFAYVAAEVDAWKPDPRIFGRALEITGSLPLQTLYIGDNYYADVLGAKNAGIQAVLLDPNGTFTDVAFTRDCTVIHTIQELGSLL
jgi:HAD superfamily hydrolase (TIGR01549 family)